MSSIAAPVVPVMLAMPVPMPSIAVLRPGEPWRFPFTSTPPATVNRANSRIRNGMYSSSTVCISSYTVSENPYVATAGSRKSSAQPALILP